MRRRARIAALALASLAACPSTAWSARVETVEEGDFLRFRAAPGELNNVTVSRGRSAAELRVEERGAPLAVGTGCRLTAEAHVALCRTDFAYVHLRDGADRLSLLVPGVAYGGAGDDVLLGGPRYSYLFGGDGSDLLSGGSGSDWLFGDRNSLSGLVKPYGPATGNDTLDGGPGHDWLGGGPGDDKLAGGPGNDALSGAGPPVLQPGGRPSGGADSYRGGAGIDVAEYNFQPASGRRVLRAPRLDITFDGRGNDGPAGGRDEVAADVERAYSLSAAFLVADGGSFGLLSLEGFRAFDYRPRANRRPDVGARIYRLSARGTAGSEAGVFSGGDFSVEEGPSRRRPTTIRVAPQGVERCPGGGRARASRHSRRVIRRISGNARGRFRTRGRYSAATVRGTSWSVTERCDGTLTRVRSGRVVVRDLRMRTTVVLTSGESYLARAPH